MTEIKPFVKSRNDLLDEKQRLKDQIQAGKGNIKNSFAGLKDELNPFKGAKQMAAGAIRGKRNNPIVKMGVAKVTNFLVTQFLLRKAGWLPRLIVPLVVNKVATRLLSGKASSKIASTLRNTADKVRGEDIVAPAKARAKSILKTNP